MRNPQQVRELCPAASPLSETQKQVCFQVKSRHQTRHTERATLATDVVFHEGRFAASMEETLSVRQPRHEIRHPPTHTSAPATFSYCRSVVPGDLRPINYGDHSTRGSSPHAPHERCHAAERLDFIDKPSPRSFASLIATAPGSFVMATTLACGDLPTML